LPKHKEFTFFRNIKSKFTNITWIGNLARQAGDKILSVVSWSKEVTEKSKHHLDVFFEKVKTGVWTSIERVRNLEHRKPAMSQCNDNTNDSPLCAN